MDVLGTAYAALEMATSIVMDASSMWCSSYRVVVWYNAGTSNGTASVLSYRSSYGNPLDVADMRLTYASCRTDAGRRLFVERGVRVERQLHKHFDRRVQKGWGIRQSTGADRGGLCAAVGGDARRLCSSCTCWARGTRCCRSRHGSHGASKRFFLFG